MTPVDYKPRVRLVQSKNKHLWYAQSQANEREYTVHFISLFKDKTLEFIENHNRGDKDE